MNEGLIKLVILIIIGVIVLSYFGINVRSILESDLVRDNFGYLWNGVKSIWNNYLAKPANFVWGIFYNYMWLSFIENMERIKQGRNIEAVENAPTVNF